MITPAEPSTRSVFISTKHHHIITMHEIKYLLCCYACVTWQLRSLLKTPFSPPEHSLSLQPANEAVDIDTYGADKPRRQGSWSRHIYANVSFVCAKLQYGVHLRPALKPMHLNKATRVCDRDKITREMLLN